MTDTQKLLTERGKMYGNFGTNAEISQSIKCLLRDTEGWARLSEDKKEALEMISLKISRILNGNPNIKDDWDDIAGYSTLVANTLVD